MRDITLGITFYDFFTTRAFATGIPTTLAGTPVVDIYEENNTTEITAAETLSVDYDGVTGLNQLAIVATGANGFENGKTYAAVITTGTVDSVSVVGEVVFRFTIGQSAAAVDAANATDGFSALKTLIDAVPTAAENVTAMEADGGDLSSLMEALVNKRIWTEATGNLEMFNDAGVSQGNIAAQVTTDGTFTTAKRAFI